MFHQCVVFHPVVKFYTRMHTQYTYVCSTNNIIVMTLLIRYLCRGFRYQFTACQVLPALKKEAAACHGVARKKLMLSAKSMPAMHIVLPLLK